MFRKSDVMFGTCLEIKIVFKYLFFYINKATGAPRPSSRLRKKLALQEGTQDLDWIFLIFPLCEDLDWALRTVVFSTWISSQMQNISKLIY